VSDAAAAVASDIEHTETEGSSMSETSEPATPASTTPLTLRSAGDGHLIVILDGRPVAVRVRQCFPWSEPWRHLSLRDAEEREVALVEDPAALAPADRAALERALAEAGFVLEVTRVRSIEEEVEIRHWTVETRQGRRSFQTHLDDWPRTLPSGELLIRDVAGDLYRLTDPRRMDRRSQEILWMFVD
jgi:hypothetical protein